MQIAIMAHDSKKELAVQFAIAYCGVLSKHKVCASGTIGSAITDATGLEIEPLLIADAGAIQQISSKISYNEIDLLLFFRNTTDDDFQKPTEEDSILHICDAYNVPFATNLATAEALILALDRGDIDWRLLLK